MNAPNDPRDRAQRSAVEEDRKLQADPELNLSGGRASGSQMWLVGIGAICVILLLLFGLTRGGNEDNVATTPAQEQTVPPATSRSDQSGANTPTGQATSAPTTSGSTTSAPTTGDQNTGAATGASPPRSSETEAVSGGSARDPGPAQPAPPPQPPQQ